MNHFECSIYRAFHRRQNQLRSINYTQLVGDGPHTAHIGSKLDRAQFYSSGVGTVVMHSGYRTAILPVRRFRSSCFAHCLLVSVGNRYDEDAEDCLVAAESADSADCHR